MAKEIQSVTIRQSEATRYGTIQRSLITAINNCMAVGENHIAAVLIRIKRDIESQFNDLIEAELEWKVK